MNLGLLIILITTLGYLSNWLNGKYLNYQLTHWLYRLGTIIHELSHAILCVLTGAKITEFSILSKQPHVSHSKSKLPLLGQPLISLAPIAGGLFFIYAINVWLLNNYFTVAISNNWYEAINSLFIYVSQINLADWESWVMLLLLINIGAMIGPSTKDLKNIWPILIIMLFITWPALSELCLLTISLIILNIIIQAILILIKQFLRLIPKQ